MRCVITHLDTCLSGYFQGTSHTSIAIPVTSQTTVKEVLDAIRADVNVSCDDWSEEQYTAFKAELDEMESKIPQDKKDKPFCSSIEDSENEDAESVYAYIEVKFIKD